MEDGSLLGEALNKENSLNNSLLVDVYRLDYVDGSIEHLIALAETAVSLNDFLQSKDYPWLSGGDGPVFGMHVTEGIPCLRANCHYGVSVADEWSMVGMMLAYTQNEPSIVAKCWDIDDGHILLIQSAYQLPEWVDQIGPSQCQERCWIRSGRVHLIPPVIPLNTQITNKPLTLSNAIRSINQGDSICLDDIDRVIREAVDKVLHKQQLYHRTAIAIPRSVAHLIESRPDLISTAVQAFVDQAAHNPVPKDRQSLAGTCENWLLTTVNFGRTQYAMLRTATASPHWKTEDTIPTAYHTIELKRLKRQCINQAMPHLRYAISLGVRLVAGFDYLLQKTPKPSPPCSIVERRTLQYWLRIDQECKRKGEWLEKAWISGPANAVYNLEPIMKCPVYEDEIKNFICPLSRPGELVAAQIRNEILKQTLPDRIYPVPSSSDVDDDNWMTMPDDDEMHKYLPVDNGMSTKSTSVDQSGIMDAFSLFLKGKGDVEGISSEMRPVHINPTNFMNILHFVLEVQSPTNLNFSVSNEESDPYFSRQDYELVESEEECVDSSMVRLMEQMDHELRSESSSRSVVIEGRNLENLDEETLKDAQAFSGLLSSLEAGSGSSGPLRNIMREMGIEAPDIYDSPSSDEESNDKN